MVLFKFLVLHNLGSLWIGRPRCLLHHPLDGPRNRCGAEALLTQSILGRRDHKKRIAVVSSRDYKKDSPHYKNPETKTKYRLTVCVNYQRVLLLPLWATVIERRDSPLYKNPRGQTKYRFTTCVIYQHVLLIPLWAAVIIRRNLPLHNNPWIWYQTSIHSVCLPPTRVNPTLVSSRDHKKTFVASQECMNRKQTSIHTVCQLQICITSTMVSSRDQEKIMAAFQEVRNLTQQLLYSVDWLQTSLTPTFENSVGLEKRLVVFQETRHATIISDFVLSVSTWKRITHHRMWSFARILKNIFYFWSRSSLVISRVQIWILFGDYETLT